MAAAMRKAVISADVRQLQRVQELVDGGRYRTVSEFVREAMRDKLAQLENERVADAVERYCVRGYAAEDEDLVDVQPFDRDAAASSRRSRRASR